MTSKFGEILKRLVEDKDSTKRKTNAEKKLDKQFNRNKKLKLNRLNKIVGQNKYILSEFDVDENLVLERDLKQIATTGVISLFNSIYEAQKIKEYTEPEEDDVELQIEDKHSIASEDGLNEALDSGESAVDIDGPANDKGEDNVNENFGSADDKAAEESDGGVMGQEEFFRLLNED